MEETFVYEIKEFSSNRTFMELKYLKILIMMNFGKF